MPLRDLLKKKEKLEAEPESPSAEALRPPPHITFMRSDTNTQEVIFLPDDPPNEPYDASAAVDGASDAGHLFSRLTGRSRSRSPSTASNASRSSEASKKRLSQRLGLRRGESSAVVPKDLPEIRDGQNGDGDGDGDADAWEQRATLLARENERNRSRPDTPVNEDMPDVAGMRLAEGKDGGIVASESTDDNIQEAIRLHEAGELKEATRMFGRLADPNGENNALSQVLYALALR